MSDVKKRILLADDETEFRMAVKLRLEVNGYEVIEAEDGAIALDKAKTINPDLIILDVMMPKMAGYQVARLLKFDEHYKKIPIIMLTARSQQSDKDTGMNVGANVYMTKPFKSEELMANIKQLIG